MLLLYNINVVESLFENQSYYLKLLKRKRKSKVFYKHQLIGLILANLLNDRKHKSLYIKLAKEYNEQELLTVAKLINTNKKIKNKAAYFMKIWKFTPSTTKNKKNSLEKKQLRLTLRSSKKKKLKK